MDIPDRSTYFKTMFTLLWTLDPPTGTLTQSKQLRVQIDRDKC